MYTASKKYFLKLLQGFFNWSARPVPPTARICSGAASNQGSFYSRGSITFAAVSTAHVTMQINSGAHSYYTFSKSYSISFKIFLKIQKLLYFPKSRTHPHRCGTPALQTAKPRGTLEVL